MMNNFKFFRGFLNYKTFLSEEEFRNYSLYVSGGTVSNVTHHFSGSTYNETGCFSGSTYNETGCFSGLACSNLYKKSITIYEKLMLMIKVIIQKLKIFFKKI